MYAIRSYYDKKMHYYFHSNYGRKFNDGFSRAVAYAISKKYKMGILVSISDTGFSLEFSTNQKIDILEIVKSITPENIKYVLKQALDGTNLLKRMFRRNNFV